MRVVGDSREEAQIGHPGELVVRGANVMRRYWNNSDTTQMSLRDGFFRTGDIGYQDPEESFYILAA
jgi:long-subunit acyl-CoA synthetase (AMP-forming)